MAGGFNRKDNGHEWKKLIYWCGNWPLYKMVWSGLLENKDAETVCNAFKQIILDKHGIPECILTDNGKEFRNSYIADLCEKYKLKWRYNSPNYHKTTGLVERANQTLFRKIQKLSNFGEKDWKRVVQKAAYGYNISYNRSIDTSPILNQYETIPDLEVDTKFKKTVMTQPIIDVRSKGNYIVKSYGTKDIQKRRRKDKRQFKIDDKVPIFNEINVGKIASNWWKV